MKKLNDKEYLDYWHRIHEKKGDDLATVCFPDKPLYFNLFFDRIQKHAINQYLRKEHVLLTGKKLLDIGCGRGRWLMFFHDKHHADVTGIDLSSIAVQACKKKGFNAFEGSIVEMPFENNNFDFINSTTVLLHLPYNVKGQAIAEISRVLKPGGKAILIENTWDDPSPHVFGMPVSKWEETFNKCNMRLIHKSAHYFNFFRRKLPDLIPFKDFLSIYMDYPVEYFLMRLFYSKQSSAGLQHFMVFEKMEAIFKP